jgi:predicted permease
MDILAHDLRYAFRQLARTPAFTVTAILTLAIGIGANTALFALATAMFLRPLPGVHDDGRLVWIAPIEMHNRRPSQMSYPDFLEYRDSSTVFEQAVAFANAEFSLSGGDVPVRVLGQIVGGNFFSMLGVRMARGRGFVVEEDGAPGAHPVAVISDHLWRDRFNADPGIIGRRIVLDGAPFTIVGVAPPRFAGGDLGDRLRDVWVPLAMQALITPDVQLSNRNAWWLTAMGKLKPGVSLSQAQAAVGTIASRIAARDSAGHANVSAAVFPMHGGIEPRDAQQIAPVGALAAVATGLILLICCANVSNMLLGRAVGRRREIAVRLSLGATRGRVVRQLLTESVLLAAAASACGMILAAWATDTLTSAILPTADTSPERHTIVFAIAAAAVTGLVFGLVPALHATRGDYASALKEGALGFDRRRSRLQGALVVAQVALSLVLLVASGMFLDGLFRAARADVGFEATSHVLATSFDLGMQGYTVERAAAFVTTLEREAAALPGASDVSMTNVVPLGNTRRGMEVSLDPTDKDRAADLSSRGTDVYDNIVRPGFFRTLGITLVAGRDFASTDVIGSPGVVVVSEDFARRAWPGADPIGKHLSTSGDKGPYLTVIGVARTVLTFGLGERLRPIVYRSHLQFPDARDVTLLVRSTGDATLLAPAIRRLIRGLDPNLPIYGVESLGQYRRQRLSDMAIGSSLLGIIGALAVSLASVGLYAVVAFSVGQRNREIGIRIALGAVQRQVVRLFVRQGLRLAMVGLIIGMALSAALGRVLASAFVGVASAGIATFGAIAALVVAVTMLASWIPARRAATVDPMVALRSE